MQSSCDRLPLSHSRSSRVFAAHFHVTTFTSVFFASLLDLVLAYIFHHRQEQVDLRCVCTSYLNIQLSPSSFDVAPREIKRLPSTPSESFSRKLHLDASQPKAPRSPAPQDRHQKPTSHRQAMAKIPPPGHKPPPKPKSYQNTPPSSGHLVTPASKNSSTATAATLKSRKGATADGITRRKGKTTANPSSTPLTPLQTSSETLESDGAEPAQHKLKASNKPTSAGAKLDTLFRTTRTAPPPRSTIDRYLEAAGKMNAAMPGIGRALDKDPSDRNAMGDLDLVAKNLTAMSKGLERMKRSSGKGKKGANALTGGADPAAKEDWEDSDGVNANDGVGRVTFERSEGKRRVKPTAKAMRGGQGVVK